MKKHEKGARGEKPGKSHSQQSWSSNSETRKKLGRKLGRVKDGFIEKKGELSFYYK